jgi:hypothetical protein
MTADFKTTACKPELDEDDLDLIRHVFEEKVVPKLRRHHARNGTLGCEFAGREYSGWLVRFRSAGDGFEITGYEYDRNGDEVDLDL